MPAFMAEFTSELTRRQAPGWAEQWGLPSTRTTCVREMMLIREMMNDVQREYLVHSESE